MLSKLLCTFACGAALCLVTDVAAETSLLHDVEVVWDGQLVRGTPAHIDVRLRGASSLTESQPIPGHITLGLVSPDKANPKTWALYSSAAGITPDGRSDGGPIGFTTPLVPPGNYVLTLITTSAYGDKTLERNVRVVDPSKLLFRTDRGVYKPGQTIQWRALALNAANHHPLSDAAVSVTITDPRGTQVWRDTLKTGRAGMASGSLPLASELITGKYTLSARLGAATAQTVVEVRPFQLPPFDVQIRVDEARLRRGEPVQAEVVARHHYGEPVVGKVHVQMSGASPYNARGVLDADGVFVVDVARDAGETVAMTATVIDGAQRKQLARSEFTWATPSVSVDIIPESNVAAKGREHAFTIVTADGAGQPVPATLEITVEGGAPLSRPSDGVLRVTLPLPQRRSSERRVVTSTVDSYLFEFSGDSTAMEAAVRDLVTQHRFLMERCVTAHRRSAGDHDTDKLAIVARLNGRRWTLDSVGRHPFSQRADFLVPVQGAEETCLSQVLLTGLRAVTRNMPRRASGTLEFTLRVDSHLQRFEEKIRNATVRVKARTADDTMGYGAHTVALWRRNSDAGERPMDVPKVVVDSGDVVDVSAPWGPGTVVATLMSHGTALSSIVCTRSPSGDRVIAQVPVPPGVSGLLDVRLSSISWAPPKGQPELHYASASVYARPRRLDVVVTAPTRARPGTETALMVSVHDPDGAPVGGVGVAASVVDERVLALSDPQTTLSSVLDPTTVHEAAESGKVFAALLRNPAPTKVQRGFMRAVLEKMAAKAPRPDAVLTAIPRYEAEVAATWLLLDPITRALTTVPGGIVDADGMVEPLYGVLARAEVAPEARRDPWNVARTWAYLEAVRPNWTPTFWGRRITERRLQGLVSALAGKRSLARRLLRRKKQALTTFPGLASHLAVDAWGRPFKVEPGTRKEGMTVTSAGLDGRFGSSDDHVRYDILSESPRTSHGAGGLGMMGYGSGGGGVGSAYGRISGMARSYAGGGRAPEEVAVRTRFDETVLWSIGEETGADGRLRLPFTLADSVTGFQVDVEAIGPRGGLGYQRTRVETHLESYVDVELPARLTIGDAYTARAVVMHHGESERTFEVQADARGAVAVREAGPWQVTVKGAKAVEVPLVARETGDGVVQLRIIDVETGRAVDAMERSIPVEAKGLKQRRVYTGVVEEGRGEVTVSLPDDVEPSTLSGQLRVFRGAADQALDGLEGMLREPHGCFEQTSSTTFPNLLVLQLLENKKGQEAHVAKARTLVGKGYQRLLTYEVAGGGFSWFGRAPANKALTAYGLVEFVEMARVYPVDDQLITRTRRWLVGQQTDDGSWQTDTKWASSQTPASVTAYIAWGLAEAGGAEAAVRKALSFLARRPETRNDPYTLALWVAAARRVGVDAAVPLAALTRFDTVEGSGRFIKTSGRNLFFEGGTAAHVEATAILGGAFAGDERASAWLDWLWDKRDARYGWGTTQATIHALRAAALSEREAGATEGVLSASLDGAAFASLDLAGVQIPTASLPAQLTAGRHTVSLQGDIEGRVRTDLRVQWRGTDVPKAESHGLVVHMEMPQAAPVIGEVSTVKIGVLNTQTEEIAMPMVVIPLPPGISADVASLKRLVASSRVTRFDDRGDAINLYLERLGAGEPFVGEIGLIPTAKCDVMQRPAQAYAYYEPEVRGSSNPARWQVAGGRTVAVGVGVPSRQP